MEIVTSSLELGKQLQQTRARTQCIGFVPTMGALHQGHLSLIQKAIQHNDLVVVSIFVNPTQFNNGKDLEQYPKTLESDILKIKSLSSSNIIVFAPSVYDIYGDTVSRESFDFRGLELQMEGRFRPGHFDGVGTVVQKLFNIVNPDKAYFGEKDFQQLQIVKCLVKMMKSNIEIISCPIAREPNGLAMSSRNARLTTQEKEHASKLYRTLKTVQHQFGTDDVSYIQEWVNNQFKDDEIISLEYFQISDELTLKSTQKINTNIKYRAFIAAYIRDVRLIDNIALN